MKVDPRSYWTQLKKPEKKIQDFNGVWTRDLAISVRRSNQLSYEATDVGSRSIVGSYVPVKVKNASDVWSRWSPEFFFSGFFTQLHITAFITARINLHLSVLIS